MSTVIDKEHRGRGEVPPGATGRSGGEPWLLVAPWVAWLSVAVVTGAGCPSSFGPRRPETRRPAPRTAVDAARRLCKDTPGDWRPLFAPRFRRNAPVQGVRQRLQTLRRLHGRCLGVKALRGRRVVWRFERARVLGRIYLDDAHRIAGIWFGALRVPGDTWARLLADLQRLPGRASLTALAFPEAPAARPAGSAKAAEIAKAAKSVEAAETAKAAETAEAWGGRRVLAALRPRLALAVASAFKLYVLKAIAAEIEGGRMRWDDVVRLRQRHRSLPPAPLNRRPDGAPLTVQSLATWMLAASDNTATDHLLHHVGRVVVERHAGTYNRPFLSTLEMFKLKGEILGSGSRPGTESESASGSGSGSGLGSGSGPGSGSGSGPGPRPGTGPESASGPGSGSGSGPGVASGSGSRSSRWRWARARAEQYLEAPQAKRRELLEQLRQIPRRRVKGRWKEPRLVDRLEWFFSTRDLCEEMLRLRDLPPFRATRGPALPGRWRRIAYKGGSEPGVRNVTLALQHRKSRRWHCLSITWNNPKARLDRPRFRALVRRALWLLWTGAPAAAPSEAPPSSIRPGAGPPSRRRPRRR
jgi:hypothetical protein